MDKSYRKFAWLMARFVAYGAVMILLNAIFMYDASHTTATGKFGETSLTEIIQEIFIFLLASTLWLSGRYAPDLKPVAHLGAVVFLMAFIREFNNQVDFWFYLVLPFILLFFWLIFTYRKVLLPSLVSFSLHPSFPYFIIGFLITFVFSRYFGRTDFWTTLLEDHYIRWGKNAAEEGIELLGYTLLFIGGAEMLISVSGSRNNRRSHP